MHYTHAVVVYLNMHMCLRKLTSAEINKKRVRQHTDDDVARTRENTTRTTVQVERYQMSS